LHYASVPSQPIELDDEVAAPLVESGDLERYQPGVYVAPKLGFMPDVPFAESTLVAPDEVTHPVDANPVDIDLEPTFGRGGGVQSSEEMEAANKPRPRSRRKSSED
jgi:hypothetical protein